MNSVSQAVISIEKEYGSVLKCPYNDERLIFTRKVLSDKEDNTRMRAIDKDKLQRAQELLDKGMIKYKIAETVGWNKDYLSALCSRGYLSDTRWRNRRFKDHVYELYCDNDLVAKGTVKQLSNITGKSQSTLLGYQSSDYKKYSHLKTFRMVRVNEQL